MYSATIRSHRRRHLMNTFLGRVHLMNTLLGRVHFYFTVIDSINFLSLGCVICINVPLQKRKITCSPISNVKSPKHAQIWILKLPPTSRPNCDTILTVDKEAMTRNRYNRIPHHICTALLGNRAKLLDGTAKHTVCVVYFFPFDRTEQLWSSITANFRLQFIVYR